MSKSLLVVVLAGSLGFICAGEREPIGRPENDASVIVGQSVQFKVRDAKANGGRCRWIPPPIDNHGQKPISFVPPASVQPYPDEAGRKYRPKDEWSWEWYGTDSKIDCGLRIMKTVRYDNGHWNYLYANAEGEFYVYVKAPPVSVNFHKVDGAVVEYDEDFTNGQVTFTLTDKTAEGHNATCFAANSRPLAGITWMLDDDVLLKDDFNTFRTYEVKNDASYDIYDTLFYVPKPGHDGTKLRCIYDHEAYTEQELADNVNEAFVTVTVRAAPDPEGFHVSYENGEATVGRPLVLQVKFHSNPAPLNIQWYVPELMEPVKQSDSDLGSGGMTTSSATSHGRYTVHPLITEEDGVSHAARLTIDKLATSDEGQRLLLSVENRIGSTNYTVHLKGLNGLGMKTEAIAGIVIALLLLVCGVVVAFLVVKNRSRKSTWSRTSDPSAVDTNRADVFEDVQLDANIRQQEKTIQDEGSVTTNA